MSNQNIPPQAAPRWVGLFNDRLVILPRQILPVSLMRVLASVSADQVIIRDRETPQDEVLDETGTIDLAQGNVFRIASRADAREAAPPTGRAKKAISVDDRFEIVVVDELKREDLLALFDLPESTMIVRDFESPDDREVPPGEVVRFADGPAFLTRGGSARHIDVIVGTTAGFYPSEGADRLPINQPVKVQLAKAAAALKIADTSGWVARVGTREIDPEKSYAANGLQGRAEIDYSRREGGGGDL